MIKIELENQETVDEKYLDSTQAIEGRKRPKDGGANRMFKFVLATEAGEQVYGIEYRRLEQIADMKKGDKFTLLFSVGNDLIQIRNGLLLVKP